MSTAAVRQTHESGLRFPGSPVCADTTPSVLIRPFITKWGKIVSHSSAKSEHLNGPDYLK